LSRVRSKSWATSPEEAMKGIRRKIWKVWDSSPMPCCTYSLHHLDFNQNHSSIIDFSLLLKSFVMWLANSPSV
jgi:hypothetical protein